MISQQNHRSRSIYQRPSLRITIHVRPKGFTSLSPSHSAAFSALCSRTNTGTDCTGYSGVLIASLKPITRNSTAMAQKRYSTCISSHESTSKMYQKFGPKLCPLARVREYLRYIKVPRRQFLRLSKWNQANYGLLKICPEEESFPIREEWYSAVAGELWPEEKS